jgi:hypothetical protein
MGKFDEIAQNIDNVEALTRASKEDIEAIRNKVPDIDNDYVEFLGEVGFGNLGDIQLYGGLINPSEIYPAPRELLDKVLLFGDDTQGYCFGFKVDEEMRVVEVDPKGSINKEIEPTFSELMHAYFG